MDQQAWGMLMGRLERMETQLDKLIQFRGWVLGVACVSGAVGGILFQLVMK